MATFSKCSRGHFRTSSVCGVHRALSHFFNLAQRWLLMKMFSRWCQKRPSQQYLENPRHLTAPLSVLLLCLVALERCKNAERTVELPKKSKKNHLSHHLLLTCPLCHNMVDKLFWPLVKHNISVKNMSLLCFIHIQNDRRAPTLSNNPPSYSSLSRPFVTFV